MHSPCMGATVKPKHLSGLDYFYLLSEWWHRRGFVCTLKAVSTLNFQAASALFTANFLYAFLVMTRQMLTANLPFNFSNRPIFVGIVVIILQLLLAHLQLAHDALQDESRSVDTDAMDLYDIISGDRIRRPSMSSAISSTNTGRIVTSVVSTSTDRNVIRKLATSDQVHHLAVFSGSDQSNDVELSQKIGGDDTSEYQSDESSYVVSRISLLLQTDDKPQLKLAPVYTDQRTVASSLS